MIRTDAVSEGFLFTDFYELTMAQLYFKKGLHTKEVQFDHFFRNYPSYEDHSAGYCVSAGLEWFYKWMEKSVFDKGTREMLEKQKGRAGDPVFEKDFLDWLEGNWNYDSLVIRAIPEGRTVHPEIPVMTVQGNLIIAQILESALLNHINYQTLIATKASRIKEAAMGNMVVDFGLRRGQHTGANAGARAALIGGVDFSSNTGISCRLGYPPKGTHAHSMVQLFIAEGMSELEAFRAYAEVYPDDCLLLVDTIDTLKSGVPNAIKVFGELRKKGHEPAGIRLDSGDLAYLAVRSAEMLNGAGFRDASIVLSNKLDELVIWQVLTQIGKEAPRYGLDPEKVKGRLVYGVGTKLITSVGQPALDGVYKLTAVKSEGGWQPAFKFSETVTKNINPGRKRAWRIYDNDGKAIADLMSLEEEDPRDMDSIGLRHPVKAGTKRTLTRSQIGHIEPLMVDIMDRGELVYEFPSIAKMRKARRKDIDALHQGVKRILLPHRYHVSLSQGLWDLKSELQERLRPDKGD